MIPPDNSGAILGFCSQEKAVPVTRSDLSSLSPDEIAERLETATQESATQHERLAGLLTAQELITSELATIDAELATLGKRERDALERKLLSNAIRGIFSLEHVREALETKSGERRAKLHDLEVIGETIDEVEQLATTADQEASALKIASLTANEGALVEASERRACEYFEHLTHVLRVRAAAIARAKAGGVTFGRPKFFTGMDRYIHTARDGGNERNVWSEQLGIPTVPWPPSETPDTPPAD